MADVEQLWAIQVKPDVKLGDKYNTLHEVDGSSVESEQCMETNLGPRICTDQT